MRQLYVTPSDFKSLIAANVADDGSDWEILFQAGSYNWKDFTIDHRTGGKLVLRSQEPRRANITLGSVFSANQMGVTALDITLAGFTFTGIPYYSSDLSDIPYNIMHLGSLAYNASLGYWTHQCNPTYIHVTDCYFYGRGPTLALGLSSTPATYTEVFVNHLDFDELGNNGVLLFTGDGSVPPQAHTGGFAHIRGDSITARGVNGPQPAVWKGGGTSTHSSGTLSLEFFHLAGSSTVEITNFDALSEIKGSLNHDMHCFRINFINSPDVSFLFKDCRFRGHWLEGSMWGDGGGQTYLGYYHNGGLEWPDENSRPQIDFENCSFYSYISNNVSTLEIADGQPSLHQFAAAASANYDFYDCKFEWEIDRAEYQSYTKTSVFRAVSTNTTIQLHNCTHVNCAPGGWATSDSESRGHYDPNFRRSFAIMPISYTTLRSNLFVIPSFEYTGWWDYIDHSARQYQPAVADTGDYIAYLNAAGPGAFGGPYNGILATPSLAALVEGETYDLTFWYWKQTGSTGTFVCWFTDDAGTSKGTVFSIAASAVSPQAWNKFSAQVQVPVGATKLRWYCTATGSGTSSWYLDSLSLYRVFS